MGPVCLFIPKDLLPLSFSIPQVLVTLLPGKRPSRGPPTVQFSVIPNRRHYCLLGEGDNGFIVF